MKALHAPVGPYLFRNGGLILYLTKRSETNWNEPGERGKYRSETHAAMTMTEFERRIALEIARFLVTGA
jgi:hypothetical protein